MTLKKWMEKTGTSAATIAACVGVSRQVIYAWTEGEYLPTVRHLTKLHDLTDGLVSLSDFRHVIRREKEAANG